MAEYLLLLTDEGRHAEVDALLRQGLRKIRPGGVAASDRWAVPRDPLPIDARADRFDDRGDVIAKRASFRYPSPEAPYLVSVVIPCFNYGRYLGEAIESCRAQTLVGSCEIIVVDDGSTDAETIRFLETLEAANDLTVIRQANAGLPEARNAGIAAASGEFVCCLDADDILDPSYLEAMLAVHSADTSVGFAYSHVRFFGDVDEVWHTRDFDPETALTGNFTSVAAVFRRDDWAETGGFSPEMRGGFEDWEFWIRLSTLGRRGRVVEVPLFRHRRHGHTMTHDAKAMEEELRGRIRALNSGFFTDREVRRRIARVGSIEKPSFSRVADLRPFGAAPGDKRDCVLVIVPWLKMGGAELYLLTALRALAEDFRVVVLTTRRDEHRMTAAFSSVTNDIFHLAEMLSPDHWLAFVEALVVSRRVSHVLTSGSTFGVIAAVTLKRRDVSTGVLSLIHNHAPDTPFRTAISNADSIDRFLSVSSNVESALVRAGIPKGKICQVANGVDAEGSFRPADVDPLAARARLGLEPERPLLLWVGRFAEEKRPLAFLDIVEEVARHVDVQAAMIGQGTLSEAIETRISSRRLDGRVFRPGALPQGELPAWYAAADMTVLTSSIEGMPGAVLEALSMGCPVASTDVGDVALVVRDGENGFVRPAGEVLSLASPILEALRTGRFRDRRDDIRRMLLDTRFVQSVMLADIRAALWQTGPIPTESAPSRRP